MRTTYRRFEVLLPLRFNDKRRVPKAVVKATLQELENQFGAVSCETQIIRGRWRHEGRTHEDDLVRIFVDVPDNQRNQKFFRDLKRRIKERFKQIDIWMTSYPIDVVEG